MRILSRSSLSSGEQEGRRRDARQHGHACHGVCLVCAAVGSG